MKCSANRLGFAPANWPAVVVAINGTTTSADAGALVFGATDPAISWLSGSLAASPITTCRIGSNGSARLDDAFAWKEELTLSRALTLQYDKVMFILEPSEQAKAAIGKRVTVIDYPDGRLAIRYRGVELAYRTFDKIRQVSQASIVENKHLGAALAFIRDQQLRREPKRRSGPRRRDQRDARLFKVG